MAKSPKNPDSNSKNLSRHSQVPHRKMKSKVGGKNFKSYNQSKHFNRNPQRRFSIADTSSSSQSDSESERAYNYYQKKKYKSSSDSDSSLTAVSGNDEAEASRKGSVFFENGNADNIYKPEKISPKKGKQSNQHSHQPRKTTSKSNHIAKKRTPKKTVNWNQWDKNLNEHLDYDESDSSNDEEVGLGGLYSMMNNQKGNSEQESDDDSESDDEEQDYSSSDDSDVDFVQLQAERKAKSMKAVKAMKKLSKEQKKDMQNDSDSSEESDHIPEKKTNTYRRRSSSVSKPKFGRRKSDVAFPDINFTFEFDDYNKYDGNAIIDEEDEENDIAEERSIIADGDQEEDIGEEVSYSVQNTPMKKKTNSNSNNNNNNNNNNNHSHNHNFDLDFDLDTQLLPVPKLDDNEINSDEDYEIDDNELLATLQAENDMDQFSTPGRLDMTNHTRNNSVGSYGDDEENDLFLKEEEKFLVNEFENNGFDEDESINFGYQKYDDHSTRDNLIDSFNEINGNQYNEVIQYASSVDSKSDDDVDEDEEEDDDYDDFIDFDAPLFDKDEEDDYDVDEEFKVDDSDKKSPQNKRKKHKPKRRNNGLNVINSDEEDDSYLWNYFFSSDNSSDMSQDEEDHVYDDSEEQMIMEKLFKNMEENKKNNRNKTKQTGGDKNNRFMQDEISSDNEYDSGESTDVDLSLPASTMKKTGSKMAKEVLSSKTADYRPPVLGTWVAIDSKPFGIIDGLSTRTLGHNNNTGQMNNKNMEPRSVTRKNITSLTHNTTDDSAMGLDELLNVSELDDDDENDARIWRDFNSQKKQVPLGAFRNKSVLHNPVMHENVTLPNDSSYNHTSKSNNEFNQRRYSLSNHSTTTRKSNFNSTKKPSQGRKPSLSNSSNQSPNANNTDAPSRVPPSKSKRRRASNVEAASEGLRPTKSGLFSEDALADVEEILGDDNDIMGLIKGL